MKLTVKNLQAA